MSQNCKLVRFHPKTDPVTLCLVQCQCPPTAIYRGVQVTVGHKWTQCRRHLNSKKRMVRTLRLVDWFVPRPKRKIRLHPDCLRRRVTFEVRDRFEVPDENVWHLPLCPASFRDRDYSPRRWALVSALPRMPSPMPPRQFGEPRTFPRGFGACFRVSRSPPHRPRDRDRGFKVVRLTRVTPMQIPPRARWKVGEQIHRSSPRH